MRGPARATMFCLGLGLGGTSATGTWVNDFKAVDVAQSPSVATASAKTLIDRLCAPCHDKGPGRVGAAILARRFGTGKSMLERRTDLTEEFVKQVVQNGLNIMPPFRPTEISKDELDVIAKYLARKRPGSR